MGQSEFVQLPDVKVRRENGGRNPTRIYFSFNVYMEHVSLISLGRSYAQQQFSLYGLLLQLHWKVSPHQEDMFHTTQQ